MRSLSEPNQTVTTRFALIAVLVQSATTAPTAACLGLGGQVFVDAQKKLIEFIAEQSIVTHAQLPTVKPDHGANCRSLGDWTLVLLGWETQILPRRNSVST